MSTVNNFGTINNNSVTNPGNYFNNYYISNPTTSGDRNDAVAAYFEQYTGGNKSAAAAITASVIYTARAQNIDPMSLLAKFSSLPQGQLDKYVAMFLNLNRIGTSYLGVNTQPVINKYIQRAILP